ncbi:uncharacterized protein LOC5506427 isoform X1 [Nematostella vectensis]|uniref:uncharacterized protein LOC5506427 isoform X1 n=1 Tax=Nematostella vectensis TaxID=45351 RepID=UPI00207753FA|nr:uncharacterized protein LOC5506427 isoform X1 [Nematostella vectensis]
MLIPPSLPCSESEDCYDYPEEIFQGVAYRYGLSLPVIAAYHNQIPDAVINKGDREVTFPARLSYSTSIQETTNPLKKSMESDHSPNVDGINIKIGEVFSLPGTHSTTISSTTSNTPHQYRDLQYCNSITIQGPLGLQEPAIQSVYSIPPLGSRTDRGNWSEIKDLTTVQWATNTTTSNVKTTEMPLTGRGCVTSSDTAPLSTQGSSIDSKQAGECRASVPMERDVIDKSRLSEPSPLANGQIDVGSAIEMERWQAEKCQLVAEAARKRGQIKDILSKMNYLYGKRKPGRPKKDSVTVILKRLNELSLKRQNNERALWDLSREHDRLVTLQSKVQQSKLEKMLEIEKLRKGRLATRMRLLTEEDALHQQLKDQLDHTIARLHAEKKQLTEGLDNFKSDPSDESILRTKDIDMKPNSDMICSLPGSAYHTNESMIVEYDNEIEDEGKSLNGRPVSPSGSFVGFLDNPAPPSHIIKKTSLNRASLGSPSTYEPFQRDITVQARPRISRESPSIVDARWKDITLQDRTSSYPMISTYESTHKDTSLQQRSNPCLGLGVSSSDKTLQRDTKSEEIPKPYMKMPTTYEGLQRNITIQQRPSSSSTKESLADLPSASIQMLNLSVSQEEGPQPVPMNSSAEQRSHSLKRKAPQELHTIMVPSPSNDPIIPSSKRPRKSTPRKLLPSSRGPCISRINNENKVPASCMQAPSIKVEMDETSEHFQDAASALPQCPSPYPKETYESTTTDSTKSATTYSSSNSTSLQSKGPVLDSVNSCTAVSADDSLVPISTESSFPVVSLTGSRIRNDKYDGTGLKAVLHSEDHQHSTVLYNNDNKEKSLKEKKRVCIDKYGTVLSAVLYSENSKNCTVLYNNVNKEKSLLEKAAEAFTLDVFGLGSERICNPIPTGLPRNGRTTVAIQTPDNEVFTVETSFDKIREQRIQKLLQKRNELLASLDARDKPDSKRNT